MGGRGSKFEVAQVLTAGQLRELHEAAQAVARLNPRAGSSLRAFETSLLSVAPCRRAHRRASVCLTQLLRRVGGASPPHVPHTVRAALASARLCEHTKLGLSAEGWAALRAVGGAGPKRQPGPPEAS